MDKFIQANAGMFRRVNYTFDFEDYSAHELAEILLMSCRAKGFDFEAGATAEGIVSRERGGVMMLRLFRSLWLACVATIMRTIAMIPAMDAVKDGPLTGVLRLWLRCRRRQSAPCRRGHGSSPTPASATNSSRSRSGRWTSVRTRATRRYTSRWRISSRRARGLDRPRRLPPRLAVVVVAVVAVVVVAVVVVAAVWRFRSGRSWKRRPDGR